MKKQMGITLIALIITILVMLILVAVSIQIAVNSNLIGAAEQTGDAYKIATEEEANMSKVTINGEEYDSIEDYWNSKKAESLLVTTPLESWEYTISGTDIILTKYIGSDSKIFIPNTFEVDGTQYNTIIGTSRWDSTLGGTVGPFAQNNNIISIKFGENVHFQSNNGISAFYKCKSLQQVYNIPKGTTNLSATFQECSSLIYAPEIPEGVENLSSTFNNCTSLINAPKIPSTVKNMTKTFTVCTMLGGIIEIVSEDITTATDCFKYTGNPNIIYIKTKLGTTTYDTFSNIVENINTIRFFTEKSIKISCWGDSLTAGNQDGTEVNYPNVLRSLCENNVEILNFGVSGRTTSTMAAIQGGMPSIVGNDFTIPADKTPVEIIINDNYGEYVLVPRNYLYYIENVAGYITEEENKTYFTRLVEGKEQNVAKGTELISRAMTENNDADILIIWSGENDGITTQDGIDRLIAKQKSMISYANTDKYIIIGMVNSGSDFINSALSNEYGEHFLDIKKYLIENGLSDAGIVPTEEDKADISNNRTPSSLRYDKLHFNSAGYTVIGTQVYNKLISLEYISK